VTKEELQEEGARLAEEILAVMRTAQSPEAWIIAIALTLEGMVMKVDYPTDELIDVARAGIREGFRREKARRN